MIPTNFTSSIGRNSTNGEQVSRLQQEMKKAPVIFAMVLRQCSKARSSRL